MSSDNLKINYLELPLVEHAKTCAFYEAVFGWTFQDWGPDYLCFQEAGIDLGFNRELNPAAGGNGVLVVIFADDLE